MPATAMGVSASATQFPAPRDTAAKNAARCPGSSGGSGSVIRPAGHAIGSRRKDDSKQQRSSGRDAASTRNEAGGVSAGSGIRDEGGAGVYRETNSAAR